MGIVRPPRSDARMAAALMPIWSVMKLQTVLMDQTRCIVNNVSSSHSGLENLVSAQGWLQCSMLDSAFCCSVFSWPCMSSHCCHIFRFCHLPYLWLLQLISPLGFFLLLSSLSLPVRLQSLPSPPLPMFYFWMIIPSLLVYGGGKLNHDFSQLVQHQNPLNILTLC